MEMCDEDKSNDDIQEPSLEDKFSKLFSELEHCPESEQRKIIEEMNEIVDEMNKKELQSISSIKIFNKMNEMIEEKKMSMGNAILLLKHVGYCKVMKNVWNSCFDSSSLGERFKKMIIDEEKIKKEKNEKLLVDLCECYLLFYIEFPSSEFLSICIPNLLKVVLNKEESEEVQTEVEMALLALSCDSINKLNLELCLNGMREIIQYHQEHHNLTQLAYQSAWSFLIYRFWFDNSLEEVIANELHFSREAARELEELMKCIDWKKKGGEEMNKEEAKEEFALMRWLRTLNSFFLRYRLWNEEFIGLINSIVQIYRAAKDNHSVISDWCICSLKKAAENRVVRIEDLLKGGAIDAVLEELNRPTLDDVIVYDCLKFLVNVSIKLKEKNKDEREEVKGKELNRKVFEKMEEEGYEDSITSFHETLEFLKRNYHFFPKKISDYFVNI